MLQGTEIRIGPYALNREEAEVNGSLVQMDGERYYKINNYDQMRPFLMTMVSHADHWMFISSNGGLTAGRINANNALFPYYTDDKITDNAENTGNVSIFLVEQGGKQFLWEPFSERYKDAYKTTNNLYKSVYGNKIIFEEINHDLNCTFRYTWFSSDKFGFIKRSEIKNNNKEEVNISLLDGIQNILPSGVITSMQLNYSNLVNAYKRNELCEPSGMGIYSLSSNIIDRPEPSESFKATAVWSLGIESANILISALQLDRFRQGKALHNEHDIRAERGAYLVHTYVQLDAGQSKDWYIVADVNQAHADIVKLKTMLSDVPLLKSELLRDIRLGNEQLKRLVAKADGLQHTNDEKSKVRHFANVTFNIMRGGIFDEGYMVDKADLTDYIQTHNTAVAGQYAEWLNDMPDKLHYLNLIERCKKRNSPDLERLVREYLPLTFSRRHGDPSRPWNVFNIDIRKQDGSKNLYYEGNWRDIFQNWEALSYTYPDFIEGMICKFLNASTIEGYNPYRINKDGIDWEVTDPDDPWSFIGYWGDHQVIYLLKLLELSQAYHPGSLTGFLTDKIFAYANVPYRIKGYEDICDDPYNTIIFDNDLDQVIQNRVHEVGSDGKLVRDENGDILRVNLAEKLLLIALTKLSNFVPEAGIWMNTQRPEWNDANNALVGHGVSMVTLYYLRRYLAFCRRLFGGSELESISLSSVLIEKLSGIHQILIDHKNSLNTEFDNKNRKAIVDALGQVGEKYREQVYQSATGKTEAISIRTVIEFIDIALMYIDHSIATNKRDDHLYHAYNLLHFNDDKLEIRRLHEMLEGQVAILSAGYLAPEAVLQVLDALKQSRLYRVDQASYILYPDKDLPGFFSKNTIPHNEIQNNTLFKLLIKNGNTSLVEYDEHGECHFNRDITNANDIKEKLEFLKANGYGELVDRDGAKVLNTFEKIFNHNAFTGRSGSFFGYEGLGSIYWHMVSKLLLAVRENYYLALETNADQNVLDRLKVHYYEIRAGIGYDKTPEVYGAIPTDPYSHTPSNKGVQQPGMTGQVKEDIICRWGELGIVIKQGQIQFNKRLLRDEEFVNAPGKFQFIDLGGRENEIELEQGQLAFTFCQTPIVYELADKEAITLKMTNNEEKMIEGLVLPVEYSRSVFERRGEVACIRVLFNVSNYKVGD